MAEEQTKPSMSEIMQKAQEMQKSMQNAQDELGKLEIIGKSGGEPALVEIKMTGRHQCLGVKMSNDALDEPKDVIEDLIKAAINDAVDRVEKAAQQKMVDLTKSLGLPTDLGGQSEE